MRSLVLMILLLLCAGDALHAQRTDLDSLVQAIGRWEKDHEPGDTAGLIQMNRAAVVYTMRMKGDEVVEMARRTAAVASKEMGALPEGALRKGVRKQLIIALNFLGDGLVYQGDLSGGMETLQRCYALSLEAGDRSNAATACMRLGYACRKAQDRKCARDWLRKGLAVLPPADTTGRVTAHAEMGNVLYGLGDMDIARYHWQESIRIGEQRRSFSPLFDAYSGMALLALRSGANDEANKFLRKARASFEQDPSKQGSAMLNALEGIQRIALRDAQGALPFLARADSFAVAHGKHGARFFAQQFMAVSHALRGDMNASLSAADSAASALIADLGIEEAKRTAFAQARYESDVAQRLADARLQAQRRLNAVLFVAATALVIAALVLWRLYHRSKRTSRSLHAANVELVRTQEKLVKAEREHEAETLRTRIARDIHDELGGSLTKVALLGELLASGGGAQAEEVSLRALSEHARSVKAGLSDVVWAVDPTSDTAQGLFDRLTDRLVELYRGSSATLTLDLKADHPSRAISPDVKRALYLMINEAATNALRHAKARMVMVSLLIKSDRHEVRITDDGSGFTPGTASGKGNGLSNMRHRMAAIGAGIDVESAPGRGTTIIASGAL
ncbi:MAG TPA: ATP-binding protein [Flavobacteriales bacterium]|nr:ATP-binding protein [Flavobacteriales bacterium]